MQHQITVSGDGIIRVNGEQRGPKYNYETAVHQAQALQKQIIGSTLSIAPRQKTKADIEAEAQALAVAAKAQRKADKAQAKAAAKLSATPALPPPPPPVSADELCPVAC